MWIQIMYLTKGEEEEEEEEKDRGVELIRVNLVENSMMA